MMFKTRKKLDAVVLSIQLMKVDAALHEALMDARLAVIEAKLAALAKGAS